MELQLKDTITKSFETNTTWTTDWDKKTLPIIAERQTTVQKQHEKERLRLGKRFKTVENTASPFTPKQKFNGLAAKEKSSLAKLPGSFDLFEDPSRKEKRLKRFEREHKFATSSSEMFRASPAPLTPVVDTQPIVGRSSQLEKRYLRLTSAPDPEMVRPLHVLKQTLELLKQKWKQEHNYSYICDQFKSLRQDLTVQHIENDFTVLVYEIHARIALEKGDLGEYNQCQSRLKELYKSGLKGRQNEFLAYRILYLLHTQNKSEISHILVGLDADTRKDPAIVHALQVVSAVTQSNYYRLFKLYLDAPNMGGYVMDSFIIRERLTALSIICRSYRPDVALDFITSELAFADREDCVEFLKGYQVRNHIFKTGEVEKLATKEAFLKIETARQSAYKKVDINGQI